MTTRESRPALRDRAAIENEAEDPRHEDNALVPLIQLADADLDRLARRLSAAARQAARDLNGEPPELAEVRAAAAACRIELRQRRAAAGLAAAVAELDRLGWTGGR